MNITEVEELKNLFARFVDVWEKDENDSITNLAEKRIVASVIKEIMEDTIKACDSVIKDNVNEVSNWTMKEYAKSLELTFKKNSTIDPKIVEELTDEECRKGFSVTEKAIKYVGRGELLDKYKSITESKTLTLKSLKD